MYLPLKPRSWPHYLLLMAVLAALLVLTVIKMRDLEPISRAAELNTRIGELYEKKEYAKAILVAKELLPLMEQKYGRDNPYIVPYINALAVLHQKNNEPVEAEALFKRSLAIREKEHGADHPGILHSVNDLAELHLLQNRLPESQAYTDRAIEIGRRVTGLLPLELARSFAILADLRVAQGKSKEAVESFNQSILLYRGRQGEESEAIPIMEKLAEFHRKEGRAGDAAKVDEDLRQVKFDLARKRNSR